MHISGTPASPFSVIAALGGLQVGLTLAGWMLAFALSAVPSFRPYRGRMLGFVTGASPGAVVGAIAGILGIYVMLVPERVNTRETPRVEI